MNSNKRGFNLFNREMPFVWPQPIPEPPRVLNPRSMVPDLSITSDMSVNGLPSHHQKDYFDKFKTLYVSPPKQQSPPNAVPFGQYYQQLSTKLSQNYETNDNNFGERIVFNQTFNPNKDNFNHIKGFVFDNNIRNDNKNNIFTNGILTSEDKPIESQNSIKPKIVRHSTTSDPVIKGHKQSTKGSNVSTKHIHQTINGQNGNNSPTNAEMFEIIRQQDIQLQRISEQIDELLKIQKIRDKREEKVINNSNKRSVQTMTSIILDENQIKSPLNYKSKNKVKTSSNSSKTPSTATKDLRALGLNTISEYSEPLEIELDSNRLDFSESPVRPLNDSSSIEKIRENDSNTSSENPFFGRMINDIEMMLNNGSSEDTDSGRRSSCSPTPPHSRRQTQDRRHRIQLQSEQTLYIKRLAAKYLVDESSEYKTKPKHKVKRNEQKVMTTDKTDLNIYGLTKNASIATKNYLEKYGLTYSPPKVQKNINFLENNNRNKLKLNRNKILDIEALKRQHKLT